MPGILSGILFILAWGCAEPHFAETTESINLSGPKLRPYQSYQMAYTAEEYVFEPRVKGNRLGKISGDYESAPILAGYEKSVVVSKFDSLGNFTIDKTFTDGTYEGNYYIPEKLGKSGEDEIKKSADQVETEIVRLISDQNGIKRYKRNGQADYISIAQEIKDDIALKMRQFATTADSLSTDTTTGLYGKKLEMLNSLIRQSGGELTVGKNSLVVRTKSDENGNYSNTLIDLKTENVIQESYYSNGEIRLLTKYNYVFRNGRYFPSIIHTRLFSSENGSPVVENETVEIRKNIQVTPL